MTARNLVRKLAGAATMAIVTASFSANAEVYDLPPEGNDVIGAVTIVTARADDTLLDIAAKNERIVEHPEARVRIREFADNSINMDFMGWIRRPADRGLTIHELSLEVIKRFREDHITIPFPQRDLYLKSLEEKKDGALPEKEAAPEQKDSTLQENPSEQENPLEHGDPLPKA